MYLEDDKKLGIAPGSRIGHVYLQVADLDETEKFYEQLIFSLKTNFGRRAKFFAAGEYHLDSKYSGYRDRKWEPLNDGDSVLIEFFEKGYWTKYNTVKIVVTENDVLVTDYTDYGFSPAPASITIFMRD